MKNNGLELTDDQLNAYKAIEGMNLIQNIVSTGRFFFLRDKKSQLSLPNMQNQGSLLIDAYGLCGNHQYLFIELLKRIGVRARAVDFYYTLNGEFQNHAAAEVKTGNKWIFFDITWGSYWQTNTNNPLEILTLEEILQGKGIRKTNNNSWYIAQEQYSIQQKTPDVFSYLKANDLQILKNKGGTIALQIKNGVADFSNLPNYIGKPDSQAPLKMKIKGDVLNNEAEINISGIGGNCTHSYLKVEAERYPIAIGNTKIKISRNSILELKGYTETCYIVIKHLKID